MKVTAELLTPGDIFAWGDSCYRVLSNVTDQRHPLSILTTTPSVSRGCSVLAIFHLLRVTEVEVTGHEPLTLIARIKTDGITEHLEELGNYGNNLLWRN